MKTDGFKKVQISEDSSEDSDDTEELRKKKEAAKGKTKMIDETTLKAAQAKASEQEAARVLASVPKTSAGFEKDFNAMKKDDGAVLRFLQNIPLPTVEGYFKKSEVPFEVLQGILGSMARAGEGDWMGNFLVSLAKAENFDMTMMFCEDADRANVDAIAKKLSAGVASSVKSKY